MLASGTVVDSKFEIISGLAMGGFGVVYQARQLAFDRIVALKILQSQTEIDKEDIQRFEREARILSSLRHRNLVTFYGFGAAECSLYIAMELVHGDNLELLVTRKQRLGVEETIHLVKQVCEALICAHGHGVVHRDLKPNNIMLVATPDGPLVKLIDFGLAKLISTDVNDDQKLTEPGSTVGSVEYMSPEQCLGRPADGRSDLYAVGCVLHHCLTGDPPFTGDSTITVMHKHVKDSPPRLSATVKSGIPRGLQFVLDKALAKEVNERYQDMNELLIDLTTIEQGRDQPLIADGAPIPGPLRGAGIARRPPRSLTHLAITITGALLALALGAAMVQYIIVALRPLPVETSLMWYDQARLGDTLAGSEYDKQKLGKLIELYTEALDCNRNDTLLDKNAVAHIFARLAIFYLRQGNMGQAAHNADQAIAMLTLDDKFDPDLIQSADCYVRSCAELNRQQEALDTMRRVAHLWPVGRSYRANIQNELAIAYINVGDSVHAQEVLHEIEQEGNLTDGGRRMVEATRQLMRRPQTGH